MSTESHIPASVPRPNHAVDWKTLPVDARDYYLFTLIDGKRSLHEIRILSGLPESMVAESMDRLAKVGAIVIPPVAIGAERAGPGAPVHGEERDKQTTRSIGHLRDQVPLKGDLRAIPIPDVFARLARGGHTGYLRVRQGKARKQVGLIQGRVVGVEAVLTNEYFGKYLLDKGAISIAQYSQSLERMYREKKKQGEVLAEMGVLTGDALGLEMALHARARILDVFRWVEGDFEFEPTPAVESYFPPLDLIPLVFEGAKEHFPIERIRPYLEPMGPLYILPEASGVGLLPSIGMNALERDVWERISGGRSKLKELLALPAIGVLKAFRLVYALQAAGLIDFSEQPAAGFDAETVELQPLDEDGVPTPLPIPSVTLLARASGLGVRSVPEAPVSVPSPAPPDSPLRARVQESPPGAALPPPGAVGPALAGPFAGRLSEISIVAVLREVLLGRRTGILKVSRGKAAKLVRVLEGRVLGVESYYADEPFGRFLVRIGRIGFLQYEESLARMAKEKRLHGELMVSMGYLGAEDLPALLEMHSEEKAMDLFGWEDGEFEFEEKPIRQGVMAWSIPAAKIFFGGIMRFLPADRATAQVTALLDQFPEATRKAADDLATIGLSRPALSLWAEMKDGRKTLRACLLSATLPADENLRLVFALYAMGALSFSAEAAPPRTPAKTERIAAPSVPPRSTPPTPVPSDLPPRPGPAAPPPAEPSPGAHYESAEILRGGRRRINPRAAFDEPSRFADHISGGLWDGDFNEELARETVGKTYKYLQSMHHFKILDIHESSTQEEIEEAYRKRLKTFDPEAAYRTAPEDIRETAAMICDLVKGSFEYLRDGKRRVAYRRQIFGEENLALEADVQYKKGDIYLFWRHEPAEAIPFYQSAIDLYTKNPEFHAALALAIYRCDRRRFGEAISLVQKAIAMSPDADIPHLYHGIILASEGRKESARKAFLDALRCNPRNSDAQKHLGRLDAGGGGEPG